MIFKYYLGLGSNIEPKYDFLKKAIKELNKIGKITKKSGIYQTTAWGNTKQDDFFNAVVRFRTDLNPFQLLSRLKEIEKKTGRKNQKEKWGKREIDIDILFSDNIAINKEYLKIPHQYFDQRKFVLKPMNDLNKNYVPENTNKNIQCFFKNTMDQSDVKLSIKNW